MATLRVMLEVLMYQEASKHRSIQVDLLLHNIPIWNWILVTELFPLARKVLCISNASNTSRYLHLWDSIQAPVRDWISEASNNFYQNIYHFYSNGRSPADTSRHNDANSSPCNDCNWQCSRSYWITPAVINKINLNETNFIEQGWPQSDDDE